jgi:hypothetical protein
MSRNKANENRHRAENNTEFQRKLRQRRSLRTIRRNINAAMAEARRMQKSKKKGTRDFDDNMASLGYKKIGDGPVPEQKYGRLNTEEV